MTVRDIVPHDHDQYNSIVSHPLQSYEWGEFRIAQGIKVIRKGFFDKDKLVSAFQLTIHKIPHTIFTIGYLPKGDLPNLELIEELKKIGQKNNCVYIQLEPNVRKKEEYEIRVPDSNIKIQNSFHPLFTKYTFILDLTPTEEELLKNMHHKTRYNIKVAQKHGVQIIEDNSANAFEEYWKIMQETTKRQNFYAHTKEYHQLQRMIFSSKNHRETTKDFLSYHLFLAKYQHKTLAAWVLFTFHEALYYPYGSSSSENRETMASNLMMWEAIRFGKKLGLKQFDMWGALEPNPDIKDPWFGFHRFKQGYNPQLVEFIGSYDLVINPLLYEGLKIADKLRWFYLRMKK